MEEIKTLQVDDTSFECQTLIQFSSLIKLLYKLNEKEKTLEQKIDNINQTINEKEIRIKNLEMKLDEQQPKFDEIKMGQSFTSSPNITQNIIKSEKYESSPRDMNIQSGELEDKKDKEKEKEKEESLNIELNEAKIEEKNMENINKEEKEIIDDKEKEKEKEKEKIEIKEDKKEKSEIKEDKKEKSEIKGDKKEKIEKIQNFDVIKEEKKDSHETDSSRNISPDLIKNLVKRTKESEKRINDLFKKTNEHIPLSQGIKKNNELINKNSKDILDNQNSINEILNNLSKHQKEFEDVKVKVQDFNIFDIIKSSSGGSAGDIDLSKALIMNLETKVFKKFDLYDERYKSYDTDIFKLKEDNKNLNNSINAIKTQQQKYIEDVQSSLNELNNNLTNEINEIKNQIIEIQNELNDIKNKETEKDDLINNNIDAKIKQVEEKMKEMLEQNNKNINDNLIHKINNNNKLTKDEDEKIVDLENKINDFQKQFISIENTLNSQKDKLQSMEDENKIRFNKLESLNNLPDKINLLEEEINSDSLKFNSLHQAYEKTRSDMLNLVHKIEYVNSELTKLTLQKLSSSSNEKPEITIDFSKYLEKYEFDNNKKEINNKFEKVRLAIENLGRNIESIAASLGYLVNQKDFTNYQNTVKSNFDELKISLSKKYAEKIEMNKALKLLETQIKTLSENNKKDVADNWLLAKKPLNNFLCASCESVIRGELDKKSDYIPWNKYPAREDKNYRMGHGFSKMLQLVNDDIMRNTNNDNINYNIFTNTINNNNNNSPNNTEDNNSNNMKTIFNAYTNSKFPKIKPKNIHANFRQNNKKEDENIPTGDKNKEEHLTLPLDENSNSSRPQILKIYKRNKNMSSSENKYNNSSSVNNIHRNILQDSQKNNIATSTDNNLKTDRPADK